MNRSVADGGIGHIKYPLASDASLRTSKDYGVLIDEEGISQRGTFLIDPEGVIRYQLVSDLNVARNPKEMLRVLHALQTNGLCPIGWEIGDKTL